MVFSEKNFLLFLGNILSSFEKTFWSSMRRKLVLIWEDLVLWKNLWIFFEKTYQCFMRSHPDFLKRPSGIFRENIRVFHEETFLASANRPSVLLREDILTFSDNTFYTYTLSMSIPPSILWKGFRPSQISTSDLQLEYFWVFYDNSFNLPMRRLSILLPSMRRLRPSMRRPSGLSRKNCDIFSPYLWSFKNCASICLKSLYIYPLHTSSLT